MLYYIVLEYSMYSIWIGLTISWKIQHRLEAGMQEKNHVLKQNAQVEPSKLIDQDNTRNHCQIQVARHHHIQVARTRVQA